MRNLFDAYTADYDSALEKGLSVSGEDKIFFARGRIEWLKRCLGEYDASPDLILDFGCGTGTSAPLLLDLIGPKVIGLDTSEKSLQLARSANDPARTEFLLTSDFRPTGSLDLVFSNGVFHHILRQERALVLGDILDSLKPGGFFAFWENNPWNPGTRIIMSRIPFDRDAIMLSYPEARQMLRTAGFQILRTDFLFVFPRFLRWFRPLETLVNRFPFGAQYQILCRKP